MLFVLQYRSNSNSDCGFCDSMYLSKGVILGFDDSLSHRMILVNIISPMCISVLCIAQKYLSNATMLYQAIDKYFFKP